MRVATTVVGEPSVTSGLRESLEIFTWALPGYIVWVVLGIFVSAPLARFLRTARPIAFLLFASAGLIIGATLSPTRLALETGAASSGMCDLSRLAVLTPSALLSDFDAVVNILLFVLLGFGLALLPRTRRTALIVLGAFSITFLVEMTQLLLPQLGRGCESADIVDNTVGLVLGLAAGIVATTIVGRYRGRSHPGQG